MKHLRRSILFTPGDQPARIAKAAGLPADCVAVDLEDGVGADNKAAARQAASEALLTWDFGGRERLIRVNGVASDLYAADLRETIAAGPDGYIIPMVETADDVRAISHTMDRVAVGQGIVVERVRLWAMIETALGVMNLREIAQASPRLTALMFGADAYAASVGATRTEAGLEVLWARSAVVAAAAAYGLDAVDMVRVDLDDAAGLEAECRFGRQLGYSGKVAIHPRQLDVINRTFVPGPDDVAWARRVLEAAAAQAGAFALDGRLIDGPAIKAAEAALARAKAAGV